MIIKNSLKLLIIIGFYLSLTSYSNAKNQSNHVDNKGENKTLSLDQVVNSAVKNYPKILSHYDKIKAFESDVLASKGFFDIRLKQNYSDKTRGFYDGKTYDAQIEKNMGTLGSKIYSGYRKSYGKFADYEQGQLTNNRGEFRAGAKFSLLKDRDIDENRLAVILGNLSVDEAKIELENIKMEIARDATKAYWNWFASGKILHVYQDLYQLSLNRQKQLQVRAKQGDIAQILVVENKKNLLKRKASLTKIRQEFENNCLYLSLFWRTEDGETITPKLNNLPSISQQILSVPDDKQIKKDIDLALKNRPEIKIIKVNSSKQSNELKYAKNLMQPELDVDVGVSKDQGQGSTARSQANNYANINMSIPIQMREARGKIASAEAKLSAIKYQQNLIEDQIKVEIDQIILKLNMINETYSLILEEAKLAQLLQESEVEKFKQGASNFFLVNLREQDLANAKSSTYEVFKEYQNSVADYQLAIFNNQNLTIE